MKYLVTLYLFLNCSVLSRYISKRSLLGQHHHHPQLTAVYLPPAAPEDDVAVTEIVTEPTVVETEAPAVKLAESYLVADEVANEVDTEAPKVGVADVVDVKSDDKESEPIEADETDAPVFKAVETYLVSEEVTEPAVVETEAPALKLAETNLVADELATVVPEDAGVTDDDTKSGDAESEIIEINETSAPALKSADTNLVVEEVTDEVIEPIVIETEAPLVKLAETNLVDDQVASKSPEVVGVNDVVDAKSGDDESETVEIDETAAPALKPAETYLVVEEVTDKVTEPVVIATEAPSLKFTNTNLVADQVTTEAPEEIGVTDVVDAMSGVEESETIEADETSAPAIKPAETYLVDEVIIGDVTESTLVEVEAPALKPDETELVVEEEIILDSNLLDPRIVNIPEEVAIHVKPASGYWIEVSGDRDVLVKYHD